MNFANTKFFNQVTNEIYNDCQDNSTESNTWILNYETIFVISNAQVLLLVTKEFRHQWFLQQVTDNYWKVTLSKIKLLYMIELINLHVNIFIFSVVQNYGLIMKKSPYIFHPYIFRTISCRNVSDQKLEITLFINFVWFINSVLTNLAGKKLFCYGFNKPHTFKAALWLYENV